MDNKEISIEKIKQRTIKQNSALYFALIVEIIFLIIFCLLTYKEINENIAIVIASLVFFVGILIFLIVTILGLKQNYKNQKCINEYNFKIVEDKIYKKISIKSPGESSSYYIYSEIYGRQVVDWSEYSKCQEDDFIYYIIFNRNNNDDFYKYIEGEQEHIQADLIFNISEYKISPELENCFISYDEKIGKFNLKKRMEK